MRKFSKFIAIIFCFVSFTFMQTLILSWFFFDLSSLNLLNFSIEQFISNYCLMITKEPLILVIPSIGGLGFTILAMKNVF